MNDSYSYIIISFSSLISFLSSGHWIYSQQVHRNKREPYSFKYLALAYFDILISISVLIPTPIVKSALLCTIQGFLLQFLPLAEVIWTAFITAELAGATWTGFKYFRSYKKALAINILISFFCGLVPIFINRYTQIGGWCSVQDFFLSAFLFYAIVWIVQVWNILLMAFSIRKSEKENTGGDVGKQLKKRLRRYPLILVICYAPLTLTRLMMVFFNVPKFVFTMACFTFRLLGLLNTIVYKWEGNNEICDVPLANDNEVVNFSH